VLIWGGVPNFMGILLYTVGASIVAWLGFVFFQKTRKGFADVL
ncbi:sugar ABC transporter permease, partial [Klebsiella pneumoniae]